MTCVAGTRGMWAAVLLLGVLACSTDEPAANGDALPEASASGGATSGPPSALLDDMPPHVLRTCRKYGELEPACPTRAPRVTDISFDRTRAFQQEGNLWTFYAEWNAARPGITQKNAPPAFAHINVLSGDLSNVHRGAAQRLGARIWNGREGELFLAAPFPKGGIEGDHLVFSWISGDTGYSVSLHAWEPIGEAEATLEAIVESIPSPP